MFASVVLDIATQSLDTAFTYAIPSEQEQRDLIGRVVVVPFGPRRALGFVLDTFEENDPRARELKQSAIKPLISVVSEAFFDKDGALCAQFLAHYYIAPLSSCIRLFTPPGALPRLVQQKGEWIVQKASVSRVDDRWATLGPCAHNFVPRKGSYKQEAVFAAVSKGDVRVSELAAEYGSVSSCLNALQKKGVITIEHRRRYRTPIANSPNCSTPHQGTSENGADAPACSEQTSIFRVDVKAPELNADQSHALEVVLDAYQNKSGEVVLIDGVTGSGKTEVYLRVIETVLSQGENALVLVPEISLTPQTVARFRGRFGDQVAVMHSRMSKGERYDQWDMIQSGHARVVVGARSALFTPLRNVGVIIIDEEHEGTYKQESQPRYHARTVACWQAAQKGAVVVLGSATPSFESLYECSINPRWRKVELTARANNKPLPSVEVVDMAREFSAGHRSMFSRPLIQSLRNVLQQNQKVVLMLNQRGFAKFLLCRDCGYVPSCNSCSTSLTYHEDTALCMCHHCGYSQPAYTRCPVCGSPYLKKFGAGTQRVETELRTLLAQFGEAFADVEIIRMDADTTKTKGAHQRLLEQFARADRSILLGTQMIAKGLDFADVTLVGVINADTTLHLPDFRAEEKTYDLIEQVAGRAGRGFLDGKVIVQSYNANTPAIVAAATHNRSLLFKNEEAKRKLLGYPPFVQMANILIWSDNEAQAQSDAEHVYERLYQFLEETYNVNSYSLSPATPCTFAKLKNMYRWHIVVSCPRTNSLSEMLEPFFRRLKTQDRVRISVDIDPQSML